MATKPQKDKDQILDEAAAEGRGGDSVLAHLTIGEIVLPVELAQDKNIQEFLTKVFSDLGEDIEVYTVGNKKNRINPETDQLEFWGPFGGSWNPISTITNAVSSVTSAISKAVTDGFAAVGSAINQAEKLTTGVISAIPIVGKPIAGIISAADNAIGIPNKPQTNQTLGAPGAGSQTLAAGNTQQNATSLNDQSILGAPQGSGSLTTRTISGPDNTYKLNKSTMLGL